MSDNLRAGSLDDFINKILDERPAGTLCAAPGNGDCAGNSMIIAIVAWICSLPAGEEKSRLIELLGAECFAPGKTFADLRLFVAKMCEAYAPKGAVANIRELGKSLTEEGSDAFFETLAEWLHLGITVWMNDSVGHVYGGIYAKNGTIHLVGGSGHFDAWIPDDQYANMIKMLAESGTNVPYISNPLRKGKGKVMFDLAKGQELQALLLSLANSMNSNSAKPEESPVVDINNDNNDNTVIAADQPTKPPQWAGALADFLAANVDHLTRIQKRLADVYFKASPKNRLAMDKEWFDEQGAIAAAKLAKKRK